MARFSKISLSAIAIALTACSATKPAPSPSPTAASPVPVASPVASPVVARNPNSDIGKRDMTGATIKVDTPTHAACHRNYQSVKLDTFNKCLKEGMTYVQIANVFGHEGELQSQAGDIEVWQWNAGAGHYATAMFRDKYLVSKSQIGLQEF